MTFMSGKKLFPYTFYRKNKMEKKNCANTLTCPRYAPVALWSAPVQRYCLLWSAPLQRSCHERLDKFDAEDADDHHKLEYETLPVQGLIQHPSLKLKGFTQVYRDSALVQKDIVFIKQSS